MNGLGDELLSRSCLSKDQHSGIGGCYPFYFCERNFECGAVAYDFFKFVFSANIISWQRCLSTFSITDLQ